MEILLVRAGALGDVLLTLPLLAALRERYPASRIVAAGYREIWQVAGPLVDEILSIDEPMFAGLLGGAPSQEARDWLARFDLVIRCSAVASGNGLWAVGYGPEIRDISPYPPPGVHAATWLLGVLGEPSTAHSSRTIALSPDLRLDAAERAAAAQVLARAGLRRPIFVHPGAGARWKCWPAHRFAAVADALAEAGHEIAIVEGPADYTAVHELLQHAGREYPVIRGAGETGFPLRELAALLAHGALFIGNDSGVTHLAGLAGIPVIALFGPTDPASWAPMGQVTVLRHCVKTARRAGQIRVCDDAGCMEGIEVEEVLSLEP